MEGRRGGGGGGSCPRGQNAGRWGCRGLEGEGGGALTVKVRVGQALTLTLTQGQRELHVPCRSAWLSGEVVHVRVVVGLFRRPRERPGACPTRTPIQPIE